MPADDSTTVPVPRIPSAPPVLPKTPASAEQELQQADAERVSAAAEGNCQVEQRTTPTVSLEGRVLHKRSYGNRLAFFDIGQLNASETTADYATKACNTDVNLEVVFSFEVYGNNVRLVRKDISPGDVVVFKGTFRACQRILDAVDYRILERWSEVHGDCVFNSGGLEGGDGRPRHNKALERSSEPSPPHPVPANEGSLLCKFWISNGECQRANCKRAHPQGEDLCEARKRYFSEKQQRRAQNAHQEDPHGVKEKKGHAQRAAVFAEWLCSTYGLEDLQQGGVLDVAGGRGELSFELSVKRKIPCTVVDPRCPGGDSSASSWKGWQLSRGQRSWLESSVPGLRGYAECQAYVESCPLRQCRAMVVASEFAHAEAPRREWWSEIVGKCCVVAGLHADQATGGVMELGHAFCKPWAVVPCCTFADEFPERQLDDGRPVRTYDDLVEWLRTRFAKVEVDFLPFYGKNLAVYSRC